MVIYDFTVVLVIDDLTEKVAEVALEAFVLVILAVEGIVAATYTTHNRINDTVESGVCLVVCLYENIIKILFLSYHKVKSSY